MKIIEPFKILDAMLNFSNVVEPDGGDPAEYLNATDYPVDDEIRVTAVVGPTPTIATHDVYRSLQTPNQGKDPSTGLFKAFWKFINSTLRWKMFNQILQQQTEIAVNTAVGLDLPGAGGDYANSPDIAFPLVRTTIFAKLTPDDGTPASIETVFSKHTDAGNQRTIAVQLDTTGRIKLLVSPDGTSGSQLSFLSTDISGLLDATEGWIKIIFDGDNGANSVADFYASLDTTDNKDAVEFTQLGAPDTGIQTSLFNSTALLELGSRNAGASEVLSGSIQKVVVYDGIDPETWSLIAEYDRADGVAASASTSQSTAIVWTQQGSAVLSQFIPGIIVEITPGTAVNSFAVMNVDASKIQLIMTDPVDGEVFNQEYKLLSFLGIDNIFSWLFDPIEQDINLVVFGLPSYKNAKIRLIITGSNTVRCGAFVVGREYVIGTTVMGASYGIRNYSQKETDLLTGAVTVTPGPFKSVGNFEIVVDTNRFSSVLNKLTSLRDIPVVYVAAPGVSGFIQYAFYNSFNEIYSNSAQAICQLSTEGLS